jgi:hypothetical protein
MITYQFVPAAFDYGQRRAPALALMVHMAEGGGTVGYLSRNPARGVSVHFVCERKGNMVQMLGLTRASGSINPADLRTTDDPAVYGASVARAVLGSWWHDPNSAVISCEVEGFARSGPSDVQHEALADWVADMRAKLPSLVGNLGHRDFADYKACPGVHVKWAALGGHGLYAPAVITFRYGGEPKDRGTYVALDGGADIWSRPTVTMGAVVARLLEGARWYVFQRTMLGSPMGGSTKWLGNADGTRWIPASQMAVAP